MIDNGYTSISCTIFFMESGKTMLVKAIFWLKYHCMGDSHKTSMVRRCQVATACQTSSLAMLLFQICNELDYSHLPGNVMISCL